MLIPFPPPFVDQKMSLKRGFRMVLIKKWLGLGKWLQKNVELRKY